ncbi:hypothetical protein LguiA_009011 [Lonicera macranthoides]
MAEIVKFSGPATGLLLCRPLTSLIDTVVVGQSSSIKLVALGEFPISFSFTKARLVLCDDVNYIFMCLSIATSNLVATSLARKDKDEVQHQISILLSSGLTCGVLMLFLTRCLGAGALPAFTGATNLHIIPAANTYIQVPAAYMMIGALNKRGYNAFAISVPSPSELLQIFMLAAPVFVTTMAKVTFYSLLVYFATSMGINTVASHQLWSKCTACLLYGVSLCLKPSFMPELIYGVNQSLSRVSDILLLMLGTAIMELTVSSTCCHCVEKTCKSTKAAEVTFDNWNVKWINIRAYRKTCSLAAFHLMLGSCGRVLIPYLIALCVAPSIHCLEGTLLAGWDLKFFSLSMSGVLSLGAFLLLVAGGHWQHFNG